MLVAPTVGNITKVITTLSHSMFADRERKQSHADMWIAASLKDTLL